VVTARGRIYDRGWLGCSPGRGPITRGAGFQPPAQPSPGVQPPPRRDLDAETPEPQPQARSSQQARTGAGRWALTATAHRLPLPATTVRASAARRTPPATAQPRRKSSGQLGTHAAASAQATVQAARRKSSAPRRHPLRRCSLARCWLGCRCRTRHARRGRAGQPPTECPTARAGR
jgi:hypothetical protein